MALTKSVTEDKIEVVGEHKAVQVRTCTKVLEDGVELSSGYHRHVLQCSTKSGDTWSNTDISGESTEVQGICNAVWTDAVRTAYQTAMDAQEL
jgi:hypothetical protein